MARRYDSRRAVLVAEHPEPEEATRALRSARARHGRCPCGAPGTVDRGSRCDGRSLRPRGRRTMTRSDVVKVHVAVQALWPPRLVDPLTEAAAAAVAQAMQPDATLEHALSVVDEFFRRGSPFPPSWPEIAERWQATRSGVADDPDLIAGEFLAEVNAAVRTVGLYRSPEWSDPIIGAAIS